MATMELLREPLRPFEIIAAHAVLGLEMADDRLDSGAALHLSANGSGDAASLATNPDPYLVWML